MARALAATVPNGACVHGDELRNFIVARQPKTVRARTTYRAAARVAAVFIESDYDLVVVEYVFPGMAHLVEFQREFGRSEPMYCFVLWAPLEVVEERERTRLRRGNSESGRCGSFYRRSEPERSSYTVAAAAATRAVSLVAIDKAIEIGRRQGVAVVTANNTWFSGRCAYYVERAARQGLIAIHTTNTTARVAPFGGVVLRLTAKRPLSSNCRLTIGLLTSQL